jgi:hypothetical protein
MESTDLSTVVPIIRPTRTDAWSKYRKCQIQLKTSLEKFPISSTDSSASYTKLSKQQELGLKAREVFGVSSNCFNMWLRTALLRAINCDEHVLWLRRIKRNVGYSGLYFTCEYIIQNRKCTHFLAIFELFTAANIKITGWTAGIWRHVLWQTDANVSEGLHPKRLNFLRPAK